MVADAAAMTNAEIVNDIGERIWGDHWADGISQFADINPRTLKRIHAAARDGEDYLAARGVLIALHMQLAAVLEDLAPWAPIDP